jgi:hypothetical protein
MTSFATLTASAGLTKYTQASGICLGTTTLGEDGVQRITPLSFLDLTRPEDLSILSSIGGRTFDIPYEWSVNLDPGVSLELEGETSVSQKSLWKVVSGPTDAREKYLTTFKAISSSGDTAVYPSLPLSFPDGERLPAILGTGPSVVHLGGETLPVDLGRKSLDVHHWGSVDFGLPGIEQVRLSHASSGMKQEVFTELERLVELHSQGKSYPLTIHCFKLEYAVSEDS